MSATKINWYKTSISVTGLFLTIIGTLITAPLTQKFFFLFASFLLVTAAVLEKHRFFILQQAMIPIGTVTAFLPISQLAKCCILVSLSSAAIVYFAITGEFKERITIVGCLGMLFLAIGYGVSHPIIYLLGGLFLTIYSLVVYKRGVKIGLLFGVLNLIFVFTSMIAVYNYYFK